MVTSPNYIHIRFNPLGSLLIVQSDNLSDYTSLLSDKYAIWPDKHPMTELSLTLGAKDLV